MDIRKEPIISASLVLLFLLLRSAYPESVVLAGMVVALLLIVRALYAYWRLIDAAIRKDPERSIASDITGLYVLVRFYRNHGWPALLATLGNVVLACLVFMFAILSAPAT